MHTEENTQAFPFKPITGFRYTSVASNASYSEVFLGGVYNFEDALQVGLRLPIVGTSVSGSEAIGLGNIVPFVNLALVPAPNDITLNAGLQVELPTVSDPALGDGHYLLLPTIQSGWHPGNGIFMTTLGWGRVLDSNHHHDEQNSHDDHHGHHESEDGQEDHQGHHASNAEPETNTSVVNPHAASEILLRVDLGYRWKIQDTHLRCTLRIDGIENLSTPNEETVVQMGPAIGVLLSSITTEVYTLLPVTQNRRYQSRTGMRLRIDLP